MAIQFANVAVFTLVGVAFIVAALSASKLVRPDFPDPEKATTYECGERPIGNAWFRFNPRFYIVALVFVVFDVEVAFMFPVVTVFRSWVEGGVGLWAFFEIVAFVGILAVGLAYVWRHGDLSWVRHTIEEVRRREPAAAPPQRKAA